MGNETDKELFQKGLEEAKRRARDIDDVLEAVSPGGSKMRVPMDEKLSPEELVSHAQFLKGMLYWVTITTKGRMPSMQEAMEHIERGGMVPESNTYGGMAEMTRLMIEWAAGELVAHPRENG